MKVLVNFIYKAVTMAVAIMAVSFSADAQEYVSTPVEISKEKVRVDGKVCYSHIVLERQTLFAISKAYEVTIDDIYQYNPTLKETGLKKNSIIIIPSKDAVKTSQTAQNLHTASEQPEATKQSAEPPVKAQKATRIHIKKWYEDLDVIAEQYGVSVEDIMKANNLKGRKLGKRQKLIIPYPSEVAVAAEEDDKELLNDTTAVVTMEAADTTATETAVAAEISPKTKVNAAILLPLTNAEGSPSRNNMDFYCGALLAVYDMAEKGIDCNLNVYDIMDSKSPFSLDTIEESDVVIGPVSVADITRLYNTASDLKAMVSPLDQKAEKLIREHPEMIQAPTPHLTQYNDLVKWMEEDFRDGDRVVMITEKGARVSGITSQMREALDSSSLAYNQFSYSILEGRDVTKPLTGLMTSEGANRILIASESEAFVNDVIRNLNLLIFNNLDIVLYAPSKVRSFETIEVENFHNTSMHVSLGYYIDYNSPEVKDFIKKYRALYGTEPTQFAFQGYDITQYFLDKSARYGDDWKAYLTSSQEEMLQSTFKFSKQPFGGYINNGVRRILYDKGYEIRIVR